MHSLKVSCVVVDDEPLAIQKMEGYIAKIPFLELKESFDNGISALDYLKKNTVDLLFLDIQMDDLTGIQLLEILKNKPYVIITSAYGEYALKGYELEVSDYLVKPISFERFLQAVNRVADKQAEKDGTSYDVTVVSAPDYSKHEFIFVKTEYRMQKVMFKDIHYIEGMKDYLRIVCPDVRIMTLTNFKNMLAMLPEDHFCRIHKSYIINLSKIQSIEKSHVIILNERLSIGDSFRKAFFDLLQKLKLINTKQI